MAGRNVYTVFLTLLAEQERDDAIDWYAKESLIRANKWLDEFDHLLDRLEDNPFQLNICCSYEGRNWQNFPTTFFTPLMKSTYLLRSSVCNVPAVILTLYVGALIFRYSDRIQNSLSPAGH